MTASAEQQAICRWPDLRAQVQDLAERFEAAGADWIAQGLGDDLDRLGVEYGRLLLVDPTASRHCSSIVQLLGDSGGKGIPGRKTVRDYMHAGRDALGNIAAQGQAAERAAAREEIRHAEAERPPGHRRYEIDTDKCPAPLAAAEHLLDELHGHIAWHAGRIWRFSTATGFWQALNDRDEMRLAIQVLRRCYQFDQQDQQITPFGTVRDQLDTISNLATLAGPGPLGRPSPPKVIVFQDGTYHLEQQQLVPHAAEYAATFAVDAPWLGLQNSPPEAANRFFLRAYGEDALPIVRALIRWAVDPTIRYGEAWHILGKSHSGKGLLLNLVQSLFAPELISTVAHPWMLDRPEAMQQYVLGRRIVAFEDCPPRPPRNSSSHLSGFYSIAVNEPVQCRKLHASESASVRPHARLILCSTSQLQLTDGRDGYLERVLTLPTLPRDGEKDPSLKHSLLGDTDDHRLLRGHLIGWALAMPIAEVDDVLNRNDPAGILRETAEDLAAEADPVSRFADEALVPHPGGPNYPVDAKAWQDMFDAYMLWCKRVNYTHEGNLPRFQGQVRDILGRARCLPRCRGPRPERLNLPRVDAGFALAPGLLGNGADFNGLNMARLAPGGLKRLKEVAPVDRDQVALHA